MSDPFVKEYGVTLEDGKFIKIYPMKIRDREKVVELQSKFNPILGAMNFINEDGSLNEEGYNAIIEYLQLATKQTKKEIMEWLDVENLKEITDYFTGVSQLKKMMNLQKNLEM